MFTSGKLNELLKFAEFSQWSYEVEKEEESLQILAEKMQEKGYQNISISIKRCQGTYTQAVMFTSMDVNNRFVVVAFTGTNEDGDWKTNFDFSQMDPHHDSNTEIGVHTGFCLAMRSVFKNKCLDHSTGRADSILEDLNTILSQPNCQDIPIYFTGHSLGGALATLAVYKCCKEKYALIRRNIAGLYTYGAPRCGNSHFVQDLENLLGRDFLSNRCERVVNGYDITPSLPPDPIRALPWIDWEHIKPGYHTAGRTQREWLCWFRSFVDPTLDHPISEYIESLECHRRQNQTRASSSPSSRYVPS